ncbi:MAG: hypothetical protein OXG54_07940 [Gammaproteobacteria bacterium]|nr:hypothetical protein [Gammaproteobacteria bacterium]
MNSDTQGEALKMARIKAVLFGTGNMGRLIAGNLVEKGVEITGAVSKTHVGQDLGEVTRIGRPVGVTVSEDPEEMLAGSEADIAVLATCSSMAELYPDASLCLKRGINVVTITEGAFYPWAYDPDMAADLDNLAKQHGVTLSATGVQDIFWTNSIALLSGVCHRIDSVEFEGTADFGTLGPAVLNNLPLGLTPEQFLEMAPPPNAKPPASIVGMGFEALIDKLRLTINKVDGGIELVLAGADVECIGLNKIIRAGQISGLREILTIETNEGPVFRARFAAKIFEPDDRENYVWNIRGVPDIHLQQSDVPSVEITCASIVNRIPDVLNAEPGFITAEKLDTPCYRTSSLENYVD